MDDKRNTVFPPQNISFLSQHAQQSSKDKGLLGTLTSLGSRLPRVANLLKTEEAYTQLKPTSHLYIQDPWEVYHPLIRIDGKGAMCGAYKITNTSVVRFIARGTSPLTTKWIHNLLHTRHKHLVPIQEVFQDKNQYFVYDMMFTSLEVVIGCYMRLQERQIAKVCFEVWLLAVISKETQANYRTRAIASSPVFE